MEYLDEVSPRPRAEMLPVLRSAVRNLALLAEAGERHQAEALLPDTVTAFEEICGELMQDVQLAHLEDDLSRFTELRRRLLAHRTLLCHNDLKLSNIGLVPHGGGSRLIDLGNVGMNFIGADLINVYRYHGKRAEVWQRTLHEYASSFDEAPEVVAAGAVTFAVQRELERCSRNKRAGRRYETQKLERYLRELPTEVRLS